MAMDDSFDMIVIGAGPAGEKAAVQAAYFGERVAVVDRAAKPWGIGGTLLPFMDAEISGVLAAAFAGMGMRLVLGSGAAAVERVDGALQVSLASGERLHAEKVLFAAGRKSNTEPLGLQEAGVETDARGRIVVDHTYRTTAERIYAAGDVLGAPALASVSMEQGRVAACHAFGIPFKRTLNPSRSTASTPSPRPRWRG